MIQVFDVTNWTKDEHHAIFPVGARDKEMLWSPVSINTESLKPNWPYLFKESINRYPDQFWTEIVAHIISKYLGVDVPKALPAIMISDGEVICGSLIEWFYDVTDERFIHAGSYFKRLIPNFDDRTGKEHNLEDMTLIIRTLSVHYGLVTNRIEWLADMALFDALIGNTDRHQENWGVVFQSNDKSRLSPLFDNGTSLGHERFLDKISKWNKNRTIEYINKGRHHLRFTKDDTRNRIPHFHLVGGIANLDDKFRQYMNSKIETLNLERMLSEIETLTRIDIAVPFSEERLNWIQKNITIRLELIKEELKNDSD
ncbi:HipA domain-containing protein [Thiomicrorhabdus indica]|uniref:HipA domain-containing protein n=1 Tax=Thiomicrorhabdus indica TaxID=2267253 RepID=UPI00102DE499|nr:HipA domain-containing protein [Thiomicrorhabdus indica]